VPTIVWHICWEGAYLKELQEIAKRSENIHVYGYVDHDFIKTILSKTTFVLMPSAMLETFGLVALETLIQWVPVVGLAKWWLSDFIHPDLMLDGDNPVTSFINILHKWEYPLIDISKFSYENWIARLKELTEWKQKILIINDYTTVVGGAEIYVLFLQKALIEIGKTVELYGYDKPVNRYMRIGLMLMTPIAFWRGMSLDKIIKEYNPDLIWMNSIMRYIWPYGLATIAKSPIDIYITHHDLWLISLRPSQIYAESDIPQSSKLADWIPKKMNIIVIVTTLLKWLYISYLWTCLNKNWSIQHLLPSHWMEKYYKKYIDSPVNTYPHTVFKK
jgi:glycosyltransferase involved in cell wall biosynthesis